MSHILADSSVCVCWTEYVKNYAKTSKHLKIFESSPPPFLSWIVHVVLLDLVTCVTGLLLEIFVILKPSGHVTRTKLLSQE